MYNFNEWLKNPPIKIVSTIEESIDNSVKLPKTKFKIQEILPWTGGLDY